MTDEEKRQLFYRGLAIENALRRQIVTRLSQKMSLVNITAHDLVEMTDLTVADIRKVFNVEASGLIDFELTEKVADELDLEIKFEFIGTDNNIG